MEWPEALTAGLALARAASPIVVGENTHADTRASPGGGGGTEGAERAAKPGGAMLVPPGGECRNAASVAAASSGEANSSVEGGNGEVGKREGGGGGGGGGGARTAGDGHGTSNHMSESENGSSRSMLDASWRDGEGRVVRVVGGGSEKDREERSKNESAPTRECQAMKGVERGERKWMLGAAFGERAVGVADRQPWLADGDVDIVETQLQRRGRKALRTRSNNPPTRSADGDIARAGEVLVGSDLTQLHRLTSPRCPGASKRRGWRQTAATSGQGTESTT